MTLDPKDEDTSATPPLSGLRNLSDVQSALPVGQRP